MERFRLPFCKIGIAAIPVTNDTTASIYNRLLDWAEHKYPLLLINGTDTQDLNDGMKYRCYNQNKDFCIGIKENNVFSYDGVIHNLGNTQPFLDQALSDGF